MKVKRSRLLFPLILTIVLFGIHYLVERNPILWRGVDVREDLFGSNLKLLFFAAVASLIFFTVRSFDALLFDVILYRRQRAKAPILLREIISLVFFLLLFSWAVTVIFHTKWTAFLASGTVLAVILGFALQDTLGNLFAGISLHMEGTYEVGDVIRAGEHIGMVEGVSWRATRLRTVNNSLIVLPNSTLARERLEVYPATNLNARLVSVSVSYDAPPAQVITILEQAARNVEGVAQEIPCFARVGSFGESGVLYDVKYWTRNFHNRDNIDAALRKAIWYALKRNKLTIPYPVRTLQRMPTPPRADVALGREEITHRLRAVEVLGPLSADEQDTVGGNTRVRTYSEGETILRYGQPGDSMFVLHEGRVSIRVPMDGGPSTEVAQVDAGSVIGEMALLTGEARTADVVALTDVTALEIGKECLQPILRNNPSLAAAITTKVTERRDQLALSRARATPEDHKSLLRRIRAYFGLGKLES